MLTYRQNGGKDDDMTLKDLIMNGFVKDTDKITITKPLSGSAFDLRKGNWFNDQILDFMDCEIKSFYWNEKNGFSIALK